MISLFFWKEAVFVFHIYLIFTALHDYRDIQKNDSYLMVNNEKKIPLGNIINNPGQPENHTAGGLRLKLVFINSEPGTYQGNAGGGSIQRE